MRLVEPSPQVLFSQGKELLHDIVGPIGHGNDGTLVIPKHRVSEQVVSVAIKIPEDDFSRGDLLPFVVIADPVAKSLLILLGGRLNGLQQFEFYGRSLVHRQYLIVGLKVSIHSHNAIKAALKLVII